jgi:hypothetical protein
MTEHLADRTTWDCRAGCGEWPCRAARTELAGQQDSRTLAIYMAAQMDAAIAALPAARPPQLHERFLAWTRPGWAPR